MKKHFKIITNDLFDISNRIKKINPNYVIVRNLIADRFELHNLYYFNNSFEMSLPHKFLDARVLEYIKKSLSKSNSQKIKEMNEYNLAREQKLSQDISYESEYKLKEIYRYANKSLRGYEFGEGYQNNWI